MKIQSYSVIVGDRKCNAACPYCISQMTPDNGVLKKEKVNWRNFEIGCKYAKQSDISTILLTGKGEPTLYPDEITDYLTRLEKYEFPFMELQTNGLTLENQGLNQHMLDWYDKGLTTIALSVAHYDTKKNKKIYTPNGDYLNLTGVIDKLHDIGFSVRLSCMMMKDYIDTTDKLDALIDFARENEVEQLTVRNITKPADTTCKKVANFVEEHKLGQEQIEEMRDYLDFNGTRLMELVHGAIVYDYDDQNVCLSNCLTIDPKAERLRQLIFFPDGHLRYDWQYKGAVLI